MGFSPGAEGGGGALGGGVGGLGDWILLLWDCDVPNPPPSNFQLLGVGGRGGGFEYQKNGGGMIGI